MKTLELKTLATNRIVVSIHLILNRQGAVSIGPFLIINGVIIMFSSIKTFTENHQQEAAIGPNLSASQFHPQYKENCKEESKLENHSPIDSEITLLAMDKLTLSNTSSSFIKYQL